MNDKDDAGWSPLHIATSAGRDEAVNAFLGRSAQGNAVNHNNGCPRLHYAASKNRHEIAVMLLEGGANPDAKDHYEVRAMHWEAANDNLKMIPILLYYKAATNIQDTERTTPLYLACVTRSKDLH